MSAAAAAAAGTSPHLHTASAPPVLRCVDEILLSQRAWHTGQNCGSPDRPTGSALLTAAPELLRALDAPAGAASPAAPPLPGASPDRMPRGPSATLTGVCGWTTAPFETARASCPPAAASVALKTSVRSSCDRPRPPAEIQIQIQFRFVKSPAR